MSFSKNNNPLVDKIINANYLAVLNTGNVMQ